MSTSFKDRFADFLSFYEGLGKAARAYFKTLRTDENSDVWEDARFESFAIEDGYLLISWWSTWGNTRAEDVAEIPLDTFLSFAEHQWELQQFDRKLEVSSD